MVNKVEQSIGSDRFKELMALNGGVTLSFAMDTTGSMSSEINEVNEIAALIVNEPRESAVDYILSPFNDPVTSGKSVHYVT